MTADILSLPQAAARAGVPEQQLLVWASLGTGPRCSGNPHRPQTMSYGIAELEAWLLDATKGQPHG